MPNEELLALLELHIGLLVDHCWSALELIFKGRVASI